MLFASLVLGSPDDLSALCLVEARSKPRVFDLPTSPPGDVRRGEDLQRWTLYGAVGYLVRRLATFPREASHLAVAEQVCGLVRRLDDPCWLAVAAARPALPAALSTVDLLAEAGLDPIAVHITEDADVTRTPPGPAGSHGLRCTQGELWATLREVVQAGRLDMLLDLPLAERLLQQVQALRQGTPPTRLAPYSPWRARPSPALPDRLLLCVAVACWLGAVRLTQPDHITLERGRPAPSLRLWCADAPSSDEGPRP